MFLTSKRPSIACRATNMIILQKPGQETLRVRYLLKASSPTTKSELYPDPFGFRVLIHINYSEKARGIILSETFIRSLRQRREACTAPEILIRYPRTFAFTIGS